MKTRFLQFILSSLCMLIIYPAGLKAQDPHFSQYHNLPLFLNPAHTGNGIQHLRATLVYRNQWANVASPFTSQGFMIDKSVSQFGFGLSVFKNGVGSGGFNQIFLNGNLAYHIPVSKYAKISGAIQAGMFNKSFDLSKLTFDNQYVEDSGFNPDLPSGEIFSNTSITRPDLGFGLMYQRGLSNLKVKFKPFGGVAFSHINKPKETFITDKNTLPVRQTYHFGAGIMLNEKSELRPLSVVLIQDHHHEIFAGATFHYLLPNLNKLQFGLMARNRDALIAYAGYQINNLFIGTSYDLNISSMKKATGGNGGFELTLSYIPKRKIHKAEELPKAKKDDAKAKPQKVIKTGLRHSIQEISNPSELKLADQRHHVSPFSIAESRLPQSESTQPVATPEIKSPADTQQKPLADVKINTTMNDSPSALVRTPSEKPNNTAAEQTPIRTEAKVTTRNAEVNTHPADEPKKIKSSKRADLMHIKDIDGDAIADNEDECPYIKGHASTKGCPDSDNDGIVDMKDKCPMEAGPAGNDGCPVKSETVDKSQIIRQFRNIEFETGKAIVRTPDIYDIIEYAIDVMYQYPSSTIILTGHTDSEGDELHNMKLSEARVNSVKRYLTGQGVSEKRIRTVFYGETMPLMDNSTEYGKARNRRVEINIIR